jgi:hypothetical protein
MTFIYIKTNVIKVILFTASTTGLLELTKDVMETFFGAQAKKS